MLISMKNLLDKGWQKHVGSEFSQPYMQELGQFLLQEATAEKTLYPQEADVFNAFNRTPFHKVKVVILGQDPYHGPDQAHGLSFSVPKGVAIPPSLRNIFKELQRDINIPTPSHGCLQSWADQGVLLLNATLTVQQASAGSHQKKGWESFTDKAIQSLNDHCDNIVFLLWGAYAQKKGGFINESKHKVLRSVHPSPLSAYRGFIGNQHFSLTNQYLTQHGASAIHWAIE